jgi:hypothetical protein
MNKLWLFLALATTLFLAGIIYGPDISKNITNTIQVQKDRQDYEKRCLLP